MVSREQLIATIQNLPERHLEEVYQIIKSFEAQVEGKQETESIMAQLRRIRISAAPDFSVKASIYETVE